MTQKGSFLEYSKPAFAVPPTSFAALYYFRNVQQQIRELCQQSRNAVSGNISRNQDLAGLEVWEAREAANAPLTQSAHPGL